MKKKKGFKNHLSNLVAVAFIFGGTAVPKPYREEVPVPKQAESSFLADGAKMTFAAAVAIKVKEVGPMLILRKTGELVGLLKSADNIPQEDLLLDTDDLPDMPRHISQENTLARDSGTSAPAAGSASRGDAATGAEGTMSNLGRGVSADTEYSATSPYSHEVFAGAGFAARDVRTTQEELAPSTSRNVGERR